MSTQDTTAVTKDVRQDFLSKEPMPIDPKVEEKLVVARVGLLMQQPFWGNLATRLKLVDATHIIPTAATDGKKFYYNQNFVRKLTVREAQFLFGHEVGHCVLDHFSRKGDRDPQMWNIAGDYVINGMLVEGKVGDPITVVKPLLDARYKDMFTEEVYDNIYQQAKKIDISSLYTLDEHLPEGEDGEGQGQEGGYTHAAPQTFVAAETPAAPTAPAVEEAPAAPAPEPKPDVSAGDNLSTEEVDKW